jgi:hypothetical protein
MLAGGLFALGVSCAADVDPHQGSGFEATALCVAAQERDLKARLHAQPTAVELERWQSELEVALARTGQAYLNGLSKAQARDLMTATEHTVAEWSEARLAEQVRLCLAEGRSVLAQASALQKFMVRQSAQRWLQRELGRLKGRAG